MPSSWTQNFYHAIFAVKNREPLITPDWEPRLHAFLGGIAKDLGCTPYAINGDIEHVHALIRYPSDLSHSDLLANLKSRSTHWVHDTFPGLRHFYWQEGYGGFTVSKSLVPDLVEYIRTQKEHHRTMSFKDEFMKLLRLNGIDADERDVFG
jgi:REP element-mobilizing transposase RayT